MFPLESTCDVLNRYKSESCGDRFVRNGLTSDGVEKTNGTNKLID